MARTAQRRAPQKPSHFKYRGIDQRRRRVQGTIKALSEDRAYQVLTGRGLASLVLQPVPSPFSLEGAVPSLFKIKTGEVSTFSRQMATLLDAGVSLLPALQLMSQQGGLSSPMKRVLIHLTNGVSTGMSFSHSLGQHEEVFNEVYRRTIEVGERTGQLQTALRDLADHIERQAEFAKKIKGALTYPIIVLVAGLGVVMLLITFVLPNLSSLFESFGSELPLPTRILLGLSELFATYRVPVVIGTPAIIIGVVIYLRTPAGRRFKDKVSISMPVLGPPAHMGEVARITRTLSMMIRAGLPLQEAMEILPRTTTNGLFREALQRVRQGLFLGQGLTYPMAAQGLFPPLLIQMVRVGEDSNTLDSTMRVVADFYESAAQDRIQAMIGLITPLSTIFLATLVGFVALAVIMPMYSIAGALE